jgi:ABC-type multidrug transport system ATPase subunit/pSer/pThr/pTyr-binding forkhead associated (FHA) protein
MKIVLTEVRGDQKGARHEFEKTTIKIGRDPTLNDLAFERSRWPTISRVHAELRFDGRDWYVNDAGSANGTFLNGHRISAAMKIEPGARIRLANEGPEMTVEFVDQEPALANFPQTFVDIEAAQQQAALLAELERRKRIGVTASEPQPGTPAIAVSAQAPRAVEPLQAAPESFTDVATSTTQSALICESGSGMYGGKRFVINRERTLLGRDAAADITVDEAAPVVSRRHAEIRRNENGHFEIIDLNSFNGTLVNNQRITQSTPLHDGDCVQLALGGPIFRFVHPTGTRPGKDIVTPIVEPGRPQSPKPAGPDAEFAMHTIVSRSVGIPLIPETPAESTRFLFERTFDGKQALAIGRDAQNDIQLDGLLISKFHARFMNSDQGVLVQDLGSTNGTYVNGGRVRASHLVQEQDVVQIGPFVLSVDPGKGVLVFDTRAKTRIDARAITESVRQRGKLRTLLDEISLAIEPNEFVGVLGPSGAGKSILLNLLNGRRRAKKGRVLINNLDLYQHIDSLKQSIGYVPQDDIIHRELTVYRTLYYVARLRLSRDVRMAEIGQIIGEVLDVTGLSDRRDTLVSQLSGGQRKRVSIAVELITKPSIIFLDEPTSGLDPATEERLMKLFRQIAESGRTVILTTHAMENVKLFDRVIVLLRGNLVFYGTPSEALEFIGAKDFIEMYSRLEAPAETELAKLPTLAANATRNQKRAYEQDREEITERVAEEWRARFQSTEEYRRYIEQPLARVQPEPPQSAPAGHRRSIVGGFVQWTILVRRYLQVLSSDRWNLLILFGQAPIIGFLTYLVVGKNDPRDFPYFIFALVSIWFGTSVAVRELVKERPIFERERMVNLQLFPYVASKLFVLAFIVALQTILLFASLKALHYAGLMLLPGVFYGVPQLLVMMMTGAVGITVGLFVSALVKTSEVATSLVPLILIPQILFAGLATVPTGVSRFIGATMPATWSFDEIKRLSTLDTLKEEGADPNGPTKGRGLYRHLKDLNSENFSKAREDIEAYNKKVVEMLPQQPRAARPSPTEGTERPAGNSVDPNLPPPPSVPAAVEISDDLSDYVSFKHPWGSRIGNPIILFGMLLTFATATLVVLRIRDVG